MINRIAAGEVIERPAAALKELLENAIDAGASHIDIRTTGGGIGNITISDNGVGIASSDLPLAIERHATSKLSDENILDLAFLGFRGEALSAIGAVAHLKIISKTADQPDFFSIAVDGGQVGAVARHPGFTMAAITSANRLSSGTKIIIDDLFYKTPARLKFLGSERVERTRLREVVEKIALSHPSIGISYWEEETEKYNFPQGQELPQRLEILWGREVVDGLLPLAEKPAGKELAEKTASDIWLSGFCSLPTIFRKNRSGIYFFVNGRVISDKNFYGIVRAAYQDVLASDRQPFVVIDLHCPRVMVDVNVHPTKAEVRFQFPKEIHGLVIKRIRDALHQHGKRTASAIGAIGDTIGLDPNRPIAPLPISQTMMPHNLHEPTRELFTGKDNIESLRRGNMPVMENSAGNIAQFFSPSSPGMNLAESQTTPSSPPADYLGTALFQFAKTYIIAIKKNGVVLIDQHAAHERLVYEKLKKQFYNNAVAAQNLLLPIVKTITPEMVEGFLQQQKNFNQVGIFYNLMPSAETISFTALPALLSKNHAEHIVNDIIDSCHDWFQLYDTTKKIDAILSRLSCHGSIRAGRELSIAEMNGLLREMEATDNSGQCNHGRPTYIELRQQDLEKLFGRTR